MTKLTRSDLDQFTGTECYYRHWSQRKTARVLLLVALFPMFDAVEGRRWNLADPLYLSSVDGGYLPTEIFELSWTVFFPLPQTAD
jgi:hypothetical protein